MPPEPEDHAPRTTEDRGESAGEPDVLLDVPVLNVEELDLEVEDLRARVSFQAELADMVKINVGIDAEVGTAKIEIQGIEAQAILKARLDNVRAIFSEVLTALQRDPELAQNMLRAANPPSKVGRGTARDAARTGEAADRAGTVARETVPAANTGAASDEVADGTEVTDAARRRADELGLDLSGVRGTGSGGRILVRDVEDIGRDGE